MIDILVEYWPLILRGYVRSLEICVWALVGALVVGVLVAGMRVSPVAPLRSLGSVWVTTLRNTPLTVVLW